MSWKFSDANPSLPNKSMSGIITENELEIDLSETFKTHLKHGNLYEETIL